jgi:hypothetical protein
MGVKSLWKKSKVLGSFRPQPCGSPWTFKMTRVAELALLRQWAGVLTFLNTVDIPFPMVLIGRAVVPQTYTSHLAVYVSLY